MTTSPTSTTPSAPLESNVTVSTVENMQTPSTGDVLPRTQEIIEETPAITPTESQTTTPEGGSLQQTVPDNVAPEEKPTIFVPETVSHEEAPLFVSEPTIPETEKKVEEAVSVEEKSVSEELPNTPIIETEAVSPSSTSPVETAPVDSTEPQEVAEEKPLSPLFSAPEEVTEVTAPSTTTTPLITNNGPSLSFEQPSETPPQDTTTQPHPLFENVLQNTEEAQPVNGLFDSLLTSKS